MGNGPSRIGLVDSKIWVKKSKELEQRLRKSSLADMDNRGEDSKDFYYDLLGYDVCTYGKNWKEIWKERRRVRWQDRSFDDNGMRKKKTKSHYAREHGKCPNV